MKQEWKETEYEVGHATIRRNARSENWQIFVKGHGWVLGYFTGEQLSDLSRAIQEMVADEQEK